MHNDLIQRLEALKAGEWHELRGLIATLYCAAGCDCCRDCKTWKATADTLALVFDVPRYADGSGFDWFSVRNSYRARSADNG